MSENYVLFTDSACDIHPDKLAEWNVKMLPLAFLFTDTGKEQKDHDESVDEFYKSMRAGRVAKTSCVNEEAFESEFTSILEAGQDILYMGLSGGLSVTCENAKKVADRLANKYPDRKIEAIDSLSASAGEGLFVYLAVKNREAGMTLEENAEALKKLILNVCHWFTVEDLVYLKRGGRVTPAAAAMASILHIKPVLRIDGGKLDAFRKTRGLRHAKETMLRTMEADLAGPLAGQETALFAVYSGDPALGAAWAEEVRAAFPDRAVELWSLPLSICCHTGGGAVALAAAR